MSALSFGQIEFKQSFIADESSSQIQEMSANSLQESDALTTCAAQARRQAGGVATTVEAKRAIAAMEDVYMLFSSLR